MNVTPLSVGQRTELARHPGHGGAGHYPDRKTSIDQSLANAVIAALPGHARRRLLADADFVDMDTPRVLARASMPLTHAWFPTTGVISLLTPQTLGRTLEISMVGYESLLGAGCGLGIAESAFDAEVQVPGRAWRIETPALAGHIQHGTVLRDLLVRHLYAALAQAGRHAVCTSYHTLQQQLCRWLLMNQDRTGAHDLMMTHERLARLLGVRRAGISTTATQLQAQGLIRYQRGHIVVTDRPGLEAAACDCYAQDLATRSTLTRVRALRLTG